MRVTTTFDSWAWVEYFQGSKAGKRVEEIIQASEELCTPSLALLEIKAKYLREEKPYQERIDFICQRSRIVSMDKEIALKAAEYREKLHTSDSIIYATSRVNKSKLLTGDPHFKNMPEVELL